MPSTPPDLAAFLVEAKRRTYAGLDDDATVAAPLLAGSKQLSIARRLMPIAISISGWDFSLAKRPCHGMTLSSGR